jgi:hypothetical protein
VSSRIAFQEVLATAVLSHRMYLSSTTAIIFCGVPESQCLHNEIFIIITADIPSRGAASSQLLLNMALGAGCSRSEDILL